MSQPLEEEAVGEMVIVAPRPKADCETALIELVKQHVSLPRRLGLATEREALVMTGRALFAQFQLIDV